jgi:kynurenine formamidase
VTSTGSSTASYDGRGKASPQWWPSRYGADDERGAANELTEDVVLNALGLPRQGKVIDLAQVLDDSCPLGTAPRSFNMLVLAHGSLSGTELASKQNELTYFEEHAEHTYHVGTHLDGLGHVGIGGRFYNGHPHSDIYTPTGLTKLGAENIPPVITRGIILDVAGLVGDEVLPTGFQIGVDLLEEAVKRQQVELLPGDAILLHTGWANLWHQDPDTYAAGEPGIVVEAARWLIERRPSIVGADNWAFEVVPAVDPERPFVAHQHLIAESGIYIVENITTAALRDSGVSEFLFVMTPPAVRGSTGSMVRPAAVI